MESRTIELVTRVIDGDTFETNSGLPPVRLNDVYAPEDKERGYKPAKRILEILLPEDCEVQIETVARDKFGRRVADVYWVQDGGHVNEGIRKLIGGRSSR